jgi:hypothetical protein
MCQLHRLELTLQFVVNSFRNPRPCIVLSVKLCKLGDCIVVRARRICLLHIVQSILELVMNILVNPEALIMLELQSMELSFESVMEAEINLVVAFIIELLVNLTTV